MPKIAITNTTGGRNRGCEALVTSIIGGLETVFPNGEAHVTLHTGDPDYDRDFYGSRLAGIMPAPRRMFDRWSPARQRAVYDTARILDKTILRNRSTGAAIRNILNADLVIATGGDIFTSDYGDFASHAGILHSGAPVALLAHTIGPFDKASEQLFKASTENIALCTVRESESFEYLTEIVPELSIELTADVAFLLPVTPVEQARYIVETEHHFPIENRKLIGLSVSSGILAFRSDVEPEAYLNEIAAFVDRLNQQGYKVLLLPHVQERVARNNDMFACREVFRRLQRPNENLVISMPLSASDFKGVIGLCDALIGARTHATIASMSQGIPTVSIAYSRKAWGIMRDYYGPELGKALTVEVATMNRESLAAALESALANGRTEQTAAEMKRRATINFTRIFELLTKAR